ncbi:MAG: energy transducer TonB [Deltaproteobacteria bacterium]|nr:energy transducer TonB [Deltaproteobacteria bacterium]
MIKITPQPKKRASWVVWAVAGSILVHGGLFVAGTEYAEHKDKPHYEASRIEFTAPPPEATPEPEPEPREEPPPPPPEEKPVPKRRPPKPNTQKAPPPPAEEPPKPVFGATADSVGQGDSGVAIRVGNTLETTMEKKAPPKKVQPLAPVKDTTVPVAPKVKEEIKPVPVYNLSQAPKFETRIEPVYPVEARQAEVEGVVQLEVLIDTEGRVRHVKVLKTPGAGLEKAAVAALSKSRFAPGMVNGKPVPVKIKIPYRFILDS